VIKAIMQSWQRRWWHVSPSATRPVGQKPLTVITGGSDGIGLALAQHFASDGQGILLIARDAKRLTTAAESIRHNHPAVQVATPALDITAPDAIIRLDAALTQLNGYTDILINAAGIGLAGPFLDEPATAHRRLIDLNISALTTLTHHALPAMCQRGRGGIINVASLGGYVPGPFQASYYASKAYVLSLTEAIAHEYRGQGVQISVLAPGPVATAFHARMNGDTGWYLRLLPVQTADQIARTTYWRFHAGQRVIVPGLLNPIIMLAIRALPHRLTEHLMALLLRPRRT
jgi:uncharacterized protein